MDGDERRGHADQELSGLHEGLWSLERREAFGHVEGASVLRFAGVDEGQGATVLRQQGEHFAFVPEVLAAGGDEVAVPELQHELGAVRAGLADEIGLTGRAAGHGADDGPLSEVRSALVEVEEPFHARPCRSRRALPWAASRPSI